MLINEYQILTAHRGLSLDVVKQIECDYDLNDLEEFRYFMCENFKLDCLYFEKLYVIAYHKNGLPMGIMNVGVGNKEENYCYFDNIMTFLILVGGNSFDVIHNHPNNSVEASEEDISSSELMLSRFSSFGFKLNRDIIITASGYNDYLNGKYYDCSEPDLPDWE